MRGGAGGTGGQWEQWGQADGEASKERYGYISAHLSIMAIILPRILLSRYNNLVSQSHCCCFAAQDFLEREIIIICKWNTD